MASTAIRVVRASTADRDLARQAMRINDIDGDDPDPAALEQFLADRNCMLVVAVEDGVVVGTLDGYALRRPGMQRPEFLLYEIDVEARYRRRGIGRALIGAFADEARRCDAQNVWVLTHRSNEPAVALYRACGFEPDEHGDTEMMTLPL